MQNVFSTRKYIKDAYLIMKLTQDKYVFEPKDDKEIFFKSKNGSGCKKEQKKESVLGDLDDKILEKFSPIDFSDKKITINTAFDLANISYGGKTNRHIPSAGGYYPLTLFACKINNAKITT